jgi:hypothetical protein
MPDRHPPTVQRPALLKLVEALGCRDNALRRDECSDWRITGKQGWIYSVPVGFQILFFARNGVNEWDGDGPHIEDYVRAKRGLLFRRLTQDGTGEGIFVLDRLPTKEEAATIRDILVIPKKREISDAERERLRAMASTLKSRHHKEAENTPWEGMPPASDDPPGQGIALRPLRPGQRRPQPPGRLCGLPGRR